MVNTFPDPLEVLKNNLYYKLLSDYAIHSRVDFRNKAWFTGIHDFTHDFDKDENTVLLHFLFESEKSGCYSDEQTGELKRTDGLIVKDNYIIDFDRNITEQIHSNYRNFFNQVMKAHFTNK
jgi:hypothetical protein